MADEMPVIRIEEGGPYRVSGGVPVVRTGIERNEEGEAVAWAPEEPLRAGRRYALCRCGRSSEKPFCDDSHLLGPWDAEEVADRGPRADRSATYEGTGVTMTDDRSICSHASFCRTRVTTVWEMIGETADPAVRERLEGMIGRCPSGALVRFAPDDDEAVEPSFEPSIAATRDGPLWVRGGVRIEAADGTAYEVRNRITLCRCGRSSNKPFCDGSHEEVGFRDG